MKKLVFVFSISIFLSCLETPNSFEKLPPGDWRMVLKITDPETTPSTEVAEDQNIKNQDYFKLPFNMSVEYDDDNEMSIYVINGEERIKVDAINYGRDPRTAKDTLQLNFISFDTKIDGFYEDNLIEGTWKVPYRGEKYKIPFIAYYGQKHRFDFLPDENTYNFDGDWKIIFEYDSDDAYPAIGEFKQSGNELTGTIKTETGDYRYLAGNAYGQKLRLSVFDGAHAFLFSAQESNDTIYGEFRSGNHYKSKWMATKDKDFKLTNPYEMTKSIDGENVEFAFKDTNNKIIELNEVNGKDHYKLINIMGTWCPNCKDEIHFLKEVNKKYPNIKIFSLAFEKYRDEEKALSVLRKYKNQMNISWPLLLGGYANKRETGDAFSFLDKIYSYPTLLLVDDNNNIVDIHTGFNGPATSEYNSFKKDFYSKLDNLNI